MKQNKKKLILLTKFSKNDLSYIYSKLKDYYYFIIPKKYDQTELCSMAIDAEVAIGSNITKKIVYSANKLEYYQHTGTGLDHIDLNIFKENKIIVANTHSNSKYVSEYAVAMMFSLLKKINVHDSIIRQGIWFHPKDFKDHTKYLSDTAIGKNIGIMGYGHIGKKIIKYLQGFENKFYIFKRTFLNDKINKNIFFCNLNTMAKQSDILFVCLPLTYKTKNLINSKIFAKFKKNIIIINVSRAEIINETALYYNLLNKNINGAAIDVWYGKSNINDEAKNRLSSKYDYTKLDNLIISPHRAGYVLDNSFHLNDAVENLYNFSKKMKIKNVINLKNGF